MLALRRHLPAGARQAALTSQRQQTISSSAHQRSLEQPHASTSQQTLPPTLLPPHPKAQVATDANGGHVYVKLNYFHPDTKKAPAAPKPGDLKTGRVRPDAIYVPLSKTVFRVEPRKDLLHAAVVYYLDGIRKGTASVKTRGQVNYSGRKIRPQKGTGQARLGSRGNPILRGGGVAHGPRPRDMSTKLNRRIRELALRSALSAKWNQGQLHVVNGLQWHPPPGSNSLLTKLLSARKWNRATILTAPRNPQVDLTGLSSRVHARPSATDPVYSTSQLEEHAAEIANFLIAAKNMKAVQVIELHKLTPIDLNTAKTAEDRKKPGELHAYDLLRRQDVICDLGAIEWLEQKLGGIMLTEAEEVQLDGDLKQMLREGIVENNKRLEVLRGERKQTKEDRAMVPRDVLGEAAKIMQKVKKLPDHTRG